MITPLVKCPYRFMLPKKHQGCILEECMMYEPGGYHKKEDTLIYVGRCGLSNSSDFYNHVYEKKGVKV